MDVAIHPETEPEPVDQHADMRRANAPSPAFTLDDLAEWRASGLISPRQYAAILRMSGLPMDKAREPRSAGARLSLTMVAMYFGGFMVLLAFTFFLGTAWFDTADGGRVALAAVAVAVPGLIGIGLRARVNETAGNLLIFAATGIVPLLVYTIEQAAGYWPGGVTPGHYHRFYEDVLPAWVLMEFVALVSAVAVTAFIRFPLVMLLAALWSWYLSMDMVRWIARSDGRHLGSSHEQVMAAVFGLTLVAAGIGLQRLARRDYSLWLYLFGHLTFGCAFSALALDHQRLLGWLAFPAVYCGVVVLSVVLQRRVFLVFGATGLYSWTAYIVFDTFDGALGISISFAIVGLAIVLTAAYYRSTIEPWLRGHLHARTRAPMPA